MVRAIIADPLVTERLIIKEVEPPAPQSYEAIVQVKAISLNRGEIRDSLSGDIEQRLGWDYSGIVIEQAADGSGPAKGSRVVGLLPSSAWAEQIAARTSLMSEIPDSVSFAQASTIPVAGLSALYALKKRGLLLGKKILITGSTGGVGVYAHQLAARTGAFVVGTARSEEKANLVREDGANQIIVGELSERAGQFGPYDLIIDTVGGNSLALKGYSDVSEQSEEKKQAPAIVCVHPAAAVKTKRKAELGVIPVKKTKSYKCTEIWLIF